MGDGDPASGVRRPAPNLQSRISLAVDLTAILTIVLVSAVIIPAQHRHYPEKGFFAYPLPAWLMLLAFLSLIAAGLGAAVTLIRHPLQSAAGKWANRSAIVCIGLTPAVAAVAYTLSIFDIYLPEDWGEPFQPIWVGSGIAAITCGSLARRDRDRGLLMIPLIIGSLALTFSLGEILAPH